MDGADRSVLSQDLVSFLSLGTERQSGRLLLVINRCQCGGNDTNFGLWLVWVGSILLDSSDYCLSNHTFSCMNQLRWHPWISGGATLIHSTCLCNWYLVWMILFLHVRLVSQWSEVPILGWRYCRRALLSFSSWGCHLELWWKDLVVYDTTRHPAH